ATLQRSGEGVSEKGGGSDAGTAARFTQAVSPIATGPGNPGSPPSVGGASGLELAERPDLDTADARARDAGRDVDRLVQVGGFDQPESRELLLGLGERPVHYRPLAPADADRRRGMHRLQCLA